MLIVGVAARGTECRGRLARPRGDNKNLVSGFESLAVAAVVVLLPLTALGLAGSNALSPGILLAVVIAPVWLRPGGRGRWVVILQMLSIVAVGWGLVLANWMPDRPAVDAHNELTVCTLALSTFVALGFVWWAMGRISVARVAALYGAGALLNAFLTRSDPGFDSFFKFQLSWPVTVLALSLLGGLTPKLRRSTVLAAAPLALLGIASGYRSYLGFLLLALLLLLVDRHRGRKRAGPGSPRRAKSFSVWRLAAIATVVFIMYQALSYGLVAGWFGETARERTLNELASGGSVLSAGRIEPVITQSLMRTRPMGYGPGSIPAGQEVAEGTLALNSSGRQADTWYLENYMFNGEIKLHSFWGDLWSNFGIAGLLLWGAIAWVLLGALARSRMADLGYLGVLLLLWTGWDLLFSPIYTNFPLLALSLPLVVRQSQRSEEGLLSNVEVVQAERRVSTSSSLLGGARL